MTRAERILQNIPEAIDPTQAQQYVDTLPPGQAKQVLLALIAGGAISAKIFSELRKRRKRKEDEYYPGQEGYYDDSPLPGARQLPGYVPSHLRKRGGSNVKSRSNPRKAGLAKRSR